MTKTILETCGIWNTDYNSDKWEPEFMTIFVCWQLRVTLDSIRNSCDVFANGELYQKVGPLWSRTLIKRTVHVKVLHFSNLNFPQQIQMSNIYLNLSFMIVIDMSIKGLFCVERFWAKFARIDKHAWKVNGFNVYHHIVLLCITLATHWTSVEAFLPTLIAMNVLQQDAAVWT